MVDTDVRNRIGVLGATSLVGGCLLPFLTEAGWQVTAISRRTIGRNASFLPLVEPLAIRLNFQTAMAKSPLIPVAGEERVLLWVCVAPIWVLPDYFGLLDMYGARRVVAVSSTSRFSKDNSSDMAERALARHLTDAETRFRAWASESGVEWVILRPTLIYGLGQDKNITEIARFIRRFGFFPLLGKANGLRQPIHAADVAAACFSALRTPCAANRAYNISGGEVLAYRTMVTRIFTALGRRPRLLTVPLWVFRLAVATLRCLPRYRQWSAAMAERMNRDLVFDHAEAVRDLGFNPRAFMPAAEDLPI